MAIKLRKIVFDRAPTKLPGVRAGDLTDLDLDNPPPALHGWRISVRGASMHMISPPGWHQSNSTNPERRDPEGPVLVVEVPRTDVFFYWEVPADETEAFFKNTRFDGPVLGPPKQIVTGEGSILANIPPGQLGD